MVSSFGVTVFSGAVFSGTVFSGAVFSGVVTADVGAVVSVFGAVGVSATVAPPATSTPTFSPLIFSLWAFAISPFSSSGLAVLAVTDGLASATDSSSVTVLLASVAAGLAARMSYEDYRYWSLQASCLANATIVAARF